MAIPRYKRAANNRWDKQNMHFFGVKMPNRDADALISACAAAGVTPHSVFLAAARDFISTHPAPDVGGSGPADAGGLSASAPSDAHTSGGASDTSSGTDAAGHGSGADSVGAGHDPASGDASGAAAV